MTKEARKPSKKSKGSKSKGSKESVPFTVSIHGRGIDIEASFEGGDDSILDQIAAIAGKIKEGTTAAGSDSDPDEAAIGIGLDLIDQKIPTVPSASLVKMRGYLLDLVGKIEKTLEQRPVPKDGAPDQNAQAQA
jgi:hypothetical protein